MIFAELPARIGRIAMLCALVTLGACGGGGGDGTPAATTPTTPTAPVVLPNTVAVTVDDGPAALGTGSDPTRAADVAYVTVTICAPGSTSNCQAIDHVQVDTGSVGLRIVGSAIGSTLLAALPRQADAQGNAVGECYGFVSGYVFGSVRQTDLTIGGESVAAMPVQVIGDTGAFATAPSSCSSGGGDNISTVKALAANGILGIGVTPTDCGQSCANGGGGAAIYYDCPSSGCGAIVARASTTAAPFQQIPNPVSAMTQDNNGSVLVLPSLPAAGMRTATGTLYFGIGTRSNNTLGSARPLTTTGTTDRSGEGLVTVSYKGRSYPGSFIDSGSNALFFTDGTIAACTDEDATGYYCPATPVMLSPTITGVNGVSIAAAFTLYNTQTLFASGNAALPGLGADPGSFTAFDDVSDSFDFGLPIFFGHSVYTAIEGSSAGGTAGPYVAIG